MIVERQMRGRPVRAKICVSLLAITAITSVVLDLRADEVELTDGGRVKGKVVVESPQEGVRVLLEDGTTYSVPAALVKKVTYGDARASTTAAPPVAPAPPAARNLVESDGRDGSHPNWTLFGIGAGIFGVGWIGTGVVTTVVCQNVNCANAEPALAFLPLFGPPAILAVGEPDGTQIAGLIVGETVQLTGFILAIVGLATTVDSGDARIESPFRMGELPFMVTPVAGTGFTGLQALGHF